MLRLIIATNTYFALSSLNEFCDFDQPQLIKNIKPGLLPPQFLQISAFPSSAFNRFGYHKTVHTGLFASTLIFLFFVRLPPHDRARFSPTVYQSFLGRCPAKSYEIRESEGCINVAVAGQPSLAFWISWIPRSKLIGVLRFVIGCFRPFPVGYDGVT